MYENLIGIMAIRKIKRIDISKSLGIDRSTLENKLNGKSKFTIAEIFYIQQKFFPDKKSEWLFKRTNNKAS